VVGVGSPLSQEFEDFYTPLRACHSHPKGGLAEGVSRINLGTGVEQRTGGLSLALLGSEVRRVYPRRSAVFTSAPASSSVRNAARFPSNAA